MTKGFKFFLVAFMLSLLFFVGVNVFAEKLEGFFLLQEINQNPQLFTAQLNYEQQLENLIPFRNKSVETLEVNAISAISVLIKNDGTSKILFVKNENKKLPIASLTKLMTALVVLDNYNFSQIVEISKEAASIEMEYGNGNLKIGEIFSVKDLLYLLLIESNNGAASALAELITERGFVDLMNVTAANLDMKKTFFVNPTGLDPDDLSELTNYSTAEDLAKLGNYVLKNKLVIWEIASNPEFNLYLLDGTFYQQLKNTNELLKEIPQIGGKTGWTPQALGCLILVSKAPDKNGYLINVVLGSENRFDDMKKLIDWNRKAYKW